MKKGFFNQYCPRMSESEPCTNSERSLNDDNFFPFKTKLMIMFIYCSTNIQSVIKYTQLFKLLKQKLFILFPKKTIFHS